MDLKRASKDDLITEINRFAAVVEQLQEENEQLKKEKAILADLVNSKQARLDRSRPVLDAADRVERLHEVMLVDGPQDQAIWELAEAFREWKGE